MELKPEEHLRQTELEGVGDIIQKEGLHVQRPEAGRESTKSGLKVAQMGSDAGGLETSIMERSWWPHLEQWMSGRGF